MIHVTSATFLTYGGIEIQTDFHNTFFHEPLWKIKEILLDKMAKRDSADPIVKVIKLNYREYGKEN